MYIFAYIYNIKFCVVLFILLNFVEDVLVILVQRSCAKVFCFNFVQCKFHSRS